MSPLLTDLYQLTMLAGYHAEGMIDTPVSFDYFFRTNPYGGSYAVFAGLAPLLEYLEQLRFGDAEIGYLRSLELFPEPFLDYLREFRFRGRVVAPPEGSVIFANTPVVSLSGGLGEVQLVETALLNLLNFQTLVATKAARIHLAAKGGTVLEFGLRRAQGPDGALSVARAAAIGGIGATSNVLAGERFGLPLRGTHAHSWVMAFPDELSAFRAYARSFPDSCVLLIDTYDTLKSGIPNALIVAGELRKRGHRLLGVRIDSGDLAYLSRKGREILDAAGFPEVKIVVSNDLDEYVIKSIRDEGGLVDIYGVGTRLATCSGEGGGALGGVYKLVDCNGIPRMKLTGDVEKTTLPGEKRLLRAIALDGSFVQDVVALSEDDPLAAGDTVYAPHNPLQFSPLPLGCRLFDIRAVVMEGGERLLLSESLDSMAERCRDELSRLPDGCLRLVNPHRYKVSISDRLCRLRASLIEKAKKENL